MLNFEESQQAKQGGGNIWQDTYNDFLNFPQLLLLCVKVHFKFTKSKKGFYLLAPKNDTKVVFKFIDATLYSKGMKTLAAVILAYMNAVSKVPVRYDLTLVVLTTFIYSAQSQSLSIDSAVLWAIPKRLFLTTFKEHVYLFTSSTNPYYSLYFSLNNFVMCGPCSSDGIASNYGLDGPGSKSSLP